MSCCLTRTFYGIGQGAFYCETFENDNKKLQVIYDCGSFNKKELYSVIESDFLDHKCDTVLFISHFHKDHINGIPELIKKVQLKCIIFPYLSPENRKFLIGYNKYIENFLTHHNLKNEVDVKTDFISNFIFDPYSTIKKISIDTKGEKKQK